MTGGESSKEDPIDPLFEADIDRAQLVTDGPRPPRTRDAATLILYRRDGATPRVLMGQRSSGHDFMPNKYVFPGGRVDAADGDAPALSELQPDEAALLNYRARRRARTYPLTAIRETFEETGLIVGRASSEFHAHTDSWTGYYAQGAAPTLDAFTFLGRAVTPPMRSKRFDARFFMADAEVCLIDDRPPVDGRELADLRWFTLEEAGELDLPNVTRYVISEVASRLIGGEALRPFALVWSPDGHQRMRY